MINGGMPSGESLFRQSRREDRRQRPQPLLTDWRNKVKKQPEREAQEVALATELFIEGSLNMFAHPTNVNIRSRIVSFDLYEMGEQLKPPP